LEKKNKKKICFYVRTKHPELFEIVDFYLNDIKIFRELGYDVALANDYKNIPNDCDLFFIWWWSSGIVPLIFAKFQKKPAIMIGNLHYSDPSIQGYKSKSIIVKLFIKYCLKKSDVQIATSKFEYDEIINFKPRNLKMIYHAIDLDKYSYRPYENREPFIFTITHLTKYNVRRKCVKEIIEAFGIVARKFPEYKLYIAGGIYDDGYAELSEKVKMLNLKDKVIFLGRVSDEEKISLYQKCKIYVQPSFFEGFGVAIAESMACGAPVLTSNLSAIPEVVGNLAEFAEPDNISGIAKGIIKIINDVKYAENLGNLGRKRIEKLFSIERRKEEMKILLDKIIK
jgi:glycosyltransferase involved in cell wall biosynthesis